jgi:hypothetical protein
MKPEARLLPCNRPFQPPSDTLVKVALIARPLLKPVTQQMCRSNTVYSQVKRGFIRYYYILSKSFSHVFKAFSNAYGDKYRIRQQYNDLQPNFGTRTKFVCDKCSSKDKTGEIMVVPMPSSASAATTGYCCKKPILTLVSSLCE